MQNAFNPLYINDLRHVERCNKKCNIKQNRGVSSLSFPSIFRRDDFAGFFVMISSSVAESKIISSTTFGFY